MLAGEVEGEVGEVGVPLEAMVGLCVWLLVEVRRNVGKHVHTDANKARAMRRGGTNYGCKTGVRARSAQIQIQTFSL